MLLPRIARLAAAALALAAGPVFAQDYDCIIEARQQIDIRTPVDGLIEKVHAARGDFVRRGQVLVTLESGPERAAVQVAKSRAEMTGQIKAAEARLTLARAKEKRAGDLAKQNFVSGNALEEAITERMLAESELKVAVENQKLAELELTRATELLNMRTIKSPFDGVVVEQYLKPGEFATTNLKEPILKMAELDPLHVEVILPSSLFGRIRWGDRGEVVPETMRGRFGATVSVVDRVMNAAAGTFGVRLELPNPKLEIPAGSRCRVRFLRQTTPPAAPPGAAKEG